MKTTASARPSKSRGEPFARGAFLRAERIWRTQQHSRQGGLRIPITSSPNFFGLRRQVSDVTASQILPMEK
jgi:hypothetical protein